LGQVSKNGTGAAPEAGNAGKAKALKTNRGYTAKGGRN